MGVAERWRAWRAAAALLWAALPQARGLADGADPAWGVTPILPESGIADVWLRIGGEAPSPDVRIELTGVAPEPIEMVRPDTGTGRDRYIARIRLAEGARTFDPPRFWRVSPSGREPILAEGDGRLSRARRPPVWAVGAAWYQVFPERFRNGNPANDPRGPDVYNPSWTSVWEEVTPEEIERAWARAGAKGRSWHRGDAGRRPLYNVVWNRRYGGDLQGLVEKLDYLEGLGITAIYLNPIFDAPSLHKYDASDHRHVDPTLGHPADPYADRSGRGRAHADETSDPATWRWTPADRYLIDVVLPECRRRGIRVILDGVWNHVGLEHWAFRDVVERGASSAYASWFRVRFGDGGDLIAWEGWDGPNGNLPEFRQTPEGDLVPPVKEHVFAVTRRWMDPDGDGDPSDGIDGWRLDVVPDVGLAFWREWTALVREINPEAVTIGEVWFRADDYLDGRAFDAQMNYPFARAVVRWLEGDPSYTSGALARELRSAAALPDPVNLAQMNLLASHDTERIASMLANPDGEYSGGRLQHGATGYDAGRPSDEAYALAEAGLAIAVCWPGSPMVYYGDEWGVYGANDPDCRKPLAWPELGAYDPRARGLVERPERYRAWLRFLSLGEVGEVLRFGLTRVLETGEADVFGFERRLGYARVVFFANRGSRDQEIRPFVEGGKRLLSRTGVAGSTLGARSAGIWWFPGD